MPWRVVMDVSLSRCQRGTVGCHAGRVDPLIDVDLVRRDLAQLVSYASVGGSESEVAVQRWCAATMQGLGLDVDLWRLDLDELRADPDYPGEEVEREEAWGCVGVSGDGTPALILNGHVDVVPPGEHEWWTGADPLQPPGGCRPTSRHPCVGRRRA